eukprot:9495979-Alexandrium_andersonii.AAC.1
MEGNWSTAESETHPFQPSCNCIMSDPVMFTCAASQAVVPSASFPGRNAAIHVQPNDFVAESAGCSHSDSDTRAETLAVPVERRPHAARERD